MMTARDLKARVKAGDVGGAKSRESSKIRGVSNSGYSRIYSPTQREGGNRPRDGCNLSEWSVKTIPASIRGFFCGTCCIRSFPK